MCSLDWQAVERPSEGFWEGLRPKAVCMVTVTGWVESESYQEAQTGRV